MRSDLQQKLENAANEILQKMEGISEEAFFKRSNNKWSAAENLAHLTFSAKVMNKALNAPKLALWYKFGRRFKGSRPVEDLIAQYKSSVFPAVTGFEPTLKPDSNLNSEIESFNKTHDKLKASLEKWSEKQLDTYLLPHVVLGKLTVREMTGFMAYHIYHHQLALEKALS